MTDLQQYYIIIQQIEDLRDYLVSFMDQMIEMEGSAANYYAANIVYPAFHDQVLLQAYRDEYFTYNNIIVGLTEEVIFFTNGIEYLENQQQQDNENERTTHQGRA